VSGRRTDIAIVGGGVAACAAALSLADSGHAVAMLAPDDGGGDRFGEFLPPAANALLRDLRIVDGFADGPHRPANVTFSAWGSDLLAERNAIVHLDGPGHVLDRPAFDRMLREQVERRGIPIVRQSVRTVTAEGDGWRLDDIAARFTLDCSGRAAVVARRQAERHRADRLVAAGAFLKQTDDTVEPTPATLVEATANGWWYASLLPDRRLSIALFGDSDLLPRRLTEDPEVWRASLAETRHISRWLESAGFEPATLPHLAAAATTWMEPAAGPAWAAAGDAAAAFDPLSSHGLATALWGGRQAALAAAAWLDGNAKPIETYAATIAHAVRRFLDERRVVYGQERRWPASPFWQRRISEAA
jgi:2-polyprenyl-6-methoxyphenol hydroxylase-like FAD-dependent oxidoreductase